MENKNKDQKEFSTCLEDLSFAEAMQKTEFQQRTGSPISQFQEDRDTSKTGKKPKYRRHEMVESIMKVHRCSDCAIRRKAAVKPHSIFARLHRWHMTWWPGWKMYQSELRACPAVENNHTWENL